MAELKFKKERCKGCGMCVETCAKGVLTIGEKINRLGYPAVTVSKPDKCIGCALCAEMCPDIVISVFK